MQPDDSGIGDKHVTKGGQGSTKGSADAEALLEGFGGRALEQDHDPRVEAVVEAALLDGLSCRPLVGPSQPRQTARSAYSEPQHQRPEEGDRVDATNAPKGSHCAGLARDPRRRKELAQSALNWDIPATGHRSSSCRVSLTRGDRRTVAFFQAFSATWPALSECPWWLIVRIICARRLRLRCCVRHLAALLSRTDRPEKPKEAPLRDFFRFPAGGSTQILGLDTLKQHGQLRDIQLNVPIRGGRLTHTFEGSTLQSL